MPPDSCRPHNTYPKWQMQKIINVSEILIVRVKKNSATYSYYRGLNDCVGKFFHIYVILNLSIYIFYQIIIKKSVNLTKIQPYYIQFSFSKYNNKKIKFIIEFWMFVIVKKNIIKTKMTYNYCPDKGGMPKLNYLEQSNTSSNRLGGNKQNLLSLSNQNQSLLVSSLEASSSNLNPSNRKRQNRLNSQFILNVKDQNQTSKNAYNSLSFNHLTLQNYQNKLTTLSNDNKTCSTNCSKQISSLKQKTLQNQRKIEQLQTLIKIFFAKNLSLQNKISQKHNQIEFIKAQIQENQRLFKNYQHNTVKKCVEQSKDAQELKASVTKISEKLTQKTNELSEVIQLQKSILQQKISKLSTFYEDKFQSLIQMVEQVTKMQQFTNKQYKLKQIQNSNTLSKFQSYKNQQNIHAQSNGHKRYGSLGRNMGVSLNSCKTRHQQKSKISYYLSKSNFNQTTNISDLSINQFSRIN